MYIARVIDLNVVPQRMKMQQTQHFQANKFKIFWRGWHSVPDRTSCPVPIDVLPPEMTSWLRASKWTWRHFSYCIAIFGKYYWGYSCW